MPYLGDKDTVASILGSEHFAVVTSAGVRLLTLDNLKAASNLNLVAKVDKLSGHTTGNVASLTAAGGLEDSGIAKTDVMQKSNNLSDVTSVATARTNLGLGTAAQVDTGSDPADVPTNSLLGDAAYKNTGTTTGTLAAGDDSRITGALQTANNLSEIQSAGVSAQSSARSNIGLGTAAVGDTGVTDGDVAVADGNLTDGDAVFATASGLETQTAATARTSLDVSRSGFTKAERTVTSSDSLGTTDETVLVNAVGGLVNLSVLSAAALDGRRFTVKKIDSSANTVTLTCAGAETLDGSSSYVLDTEDDAVTIESDGTNWHIVSLYAPGDTLVSGNAASGTTAGSLRAASEPTDSTVATTARGEGAVDWQQQRNAVDKVASGDFASLGGGLNNKASGTQSVVGGGVANESTALNATVGGGGNNVATAQGATVAGGEQNTATNTASTVGGGLSNDSTGTYATIAGGRNGDASGADSTIGGGSSNSATAQGASVLGGASNDATDVYATVGGGANNEASADYTTVAGGSQCTATNNFASNLGGENNVASGEKSSVLGGSNNTASAPHSVASGTRALADQSGMRAHANGYFAAQGDAQAFDVVLRNITTDATPTEVFLDGSTTRLAVPSGAILAGTIDILAVRTDGSSAGHWHKRFSIKNVAGTTSLVGSDDDILSEDPATASVSVTADDTNDALAVNITGVSAQVWWWIARVNGVMIRFA